MTNVRVGIVGWGLMGEVHARALQDVTTRFPEMAFRPVLSACADSSPERAADAVGRFSFETVYSKWSDLIEDVDVVLVCSPNDTHVEIVTAAAQAGRHVFCEKPVGREPAETTTIRTVAAEAGVRSMTGYVYRWAPMVRYARSLVVGGAIGAITHYRGRFLTGYASDPRGILSWRFDRERAGYGALGDLMSHVIDMAHFICGSVADVVALQNVTIPTRPLPSSSSVSHFDLADTAAVGEVTNEDSVMALARFSNGAHGVLEASRIIKGPECQMAFEIHGTAGAIQWDFERMNELRVRTEADGGETRRILSGPQHPGHDRFYPGHGVGLGYEDLATLQAHALVQLVGAGEAAAPDAPTFDDAVRVADVQHAMFRSWSSASWVRVGETAFGR